MALGHLGNNGSRFMVFYGSVNVYIYNDNVYQQ